MTVADRIAIINAVLYFVVWTIILWAGADHPPPAGFFALIPLVLLAAGLVFWRVPVYLQWMETRQIGRLFRVLGEGVVAGLLFAALGVLVSLLAGTGASGIEQFLSSPSSIVLWFVVLAVVGSGNALAIYLINALVRRGVCGP